MNYLLDNNKVYYILGFVILIWLYCMFSAPKNLPEIYNAIPFKTKGIVGYEPRYFNTEIYSMPNAKASPYVLYGSNAPSASSANTIGFERLLPQVDQLPKMNTITAYSLQASNTSV
jgi:hypothetical protein